MWIVPPLLLGLLLGSWLAVLGPARLADFVNREVVYASIVDRIEANAGNDTEFVKELFGFVQAHMFVFPGQKLNQFDLSKPPLAYLGLQSGWCDQQGGVLLTLAQRKGLAGRLVVLRDESGGARTS